MGKVAHTSPPVIGRAAPLIPSDPGLQRNNAAAVIFAHNHPSGVGEASRADELLTQSLKQALALVDVKVLDHFLVAGSGVMSFAERGLL